MRKFLLIIGMFCVLPTIGKITDFDRDPAETCHNVPRKCDRTQFNCRCDVDVYSESYAECIPRMWMCDGWKDCKNGSDEIGCICPSGYFQCGCDRGGDCADLFQCVPETVVCDGKRDCWSGNDEENEKCPRKCKLSSCNGVQDCDDFSDEMNCTDCPQDRPHRCDCNKADNFTCTDRYSCYTERQKCNGVRDCGDVSDEMNCTSCPEEKPKRCACNDVNNFTCTGKYLCYSKSQECDGFALCEDGSDEWNCSSCPVGTSRCNCSKFDDYTCTNTWPCLPNYAVCNGFSDCSDGSDEFNCLSCPRYFPHQCDCNKDDNFTCTGHGCYSSPEKCNAVSRCSDSSDEMNCTCPEGKFACDCFKRDLPTCFQSLGCISSDDVNDGKIDCIDGSDETMAQTIVNYQCGPCDVRLYRFDDRDKCNLLGPSNCDNSTCFHVHSAYCNDGCYEHSDVICMSGVCDDDNFNDKCNKVYQCSDKGLFLEAGFCNGKFDCEDGSDEIRSGPGFKCRSNSTNWSSFGCILPQHNLYDDIGHCHDNSDLCFDVDGLLDTSRCYRCMDRRLIVSTSQLCDGVIDCHDLSDECLCYGSFTSDNICRTMFIHDDPASLICNGPNPLCSAFMGDHVNDAECVRDLNGSLMITCPTKWGSRIAKLCDGRPECTDFRDECSTCVNPPAFCNDSCHDFYQMGDRYCDGTIDESYRHINDSRCPRGFDERHCPMRYYCKSGLLVSIDSTQVCDGVTNCDDGSDEKMCPKSAESLPNIFSSDTEMIDSPILRVIVWIMTVLTIVGNIGVIVTTVATLRRKDSTNVLLCNHVIILNLSIADFLMGIYLLIISVKSVKFSGNYKMYDYKWRSSGLCSAAGCLAILSSETSCFLLAILTSFRLYNVFAPIRARIAGTLSWKIVISLAWLVSIVLAVIPILIKDYFVHEVVFPNPFSQKQVEEKSNVITFACRLASLTNKTIEDVGDTWRSTTAFITQNYPMATPQGEIGYYGETSVCLPRFYVAFGATGWELTLFIITLNFVCFLFIVIGYVVIYKKSFAFQLRSNKSEKQSRVMQSRIVRLILTDFFCWMPICIMAYVKLGGVYLSTSVYAVSAAVLLPINSSLNPILYSSYLGALFEKLRCRKKKNTGEMTSQSTDVQLSVVSRRDCVETSVM